MLDPSSTIDLDALPLDDQGAFSIFRTGNTAAVFQFESRGMRELLKQAPVTRFEDIIALVALYRPGPMELIPDYVARKSGRERAAYVDARLEPILSPTYGVMVYQEQVMKIAQEIGGYTLGRRRPAAPRDGQEEARGDGQAPRHLRRGRDEERRAREAKASQLFDLMEKFAGYGFNKSHAAAYALVAYQTAYFKAHHPSAFMAANLSLVMDDTDKVRNLRDDAIAHGARRSCRPTSTRRTTASSPSTRSASATGSAASRAPARPRSRRSSRRAQRAARFATSSTSAAASTSASSTAAPSRRSCARARSTRSTPRRAALLASVGIALDAAERAQASAAQVSLFGEETAGAGGLPRRRRANGPRPSACRTRRRAIGYYLSGHPFAAYAAELAPITRTTLANLAPRQERVLVAGIVTQMRVQASRRGKMAFVTLDDGHGSAEIMVYNETFDSVRQLLREDQLVIAEVKVMQRMTEDGESQGLRIIAENVYDLATMRKTRAKRPQARLQRQRDGGHAGADPRAAPSGRQADHGVVSQRALRRRRRAVARTGA